MVEFATCGKMNGCFATVVLYTQMKIMSIYSFILIFPDQTIMAQSGNGPESESDVTSLGTRQQLNFDDDTLKGKDSYNC